MKYYTQYMDSQQVSPDFHRRLCELKPRPRRSHAGQMAALAACGAAACLALYVGLSPASGPNPWPPTPLSPASRITSAPESPRATWCRTAERELPTSSAWGDRLCPVGD